ncbi:MAG TPA: hypothetical protein VFB74_18420 [Kribbellaceae bacterium]|nr:hypothetical protein [Kribbellaceae bacterium]
MTDEHDELGDLVATALRRHAGDAPRAVDLAGTARRRVHRRRKRVMGAAAAAVAVVAIGSAIATNGLPSMETAEPNTAAGADGAAKDNAVPDARMESGSAGGGWRWESFGGIEVSVPATWSYGVTNRPWCVAVPAGKQGQPDGEVGRPGPIGYVKCPAPIPAAALGQHVWLSQAGDYAATTARQTLGGGWTNVVRVLGGVRIEVQTRDAVLRDRILGSIRQVSTDANGCPVRHPASADRPVRPAQGLAWDTRVTGLSACQYRIDRTGAGLPALVGSQRYAAAAATAILDRIRHAPADAGQGDPRAASGGSPLGDEVVVLRWTTADGVREVYLRYSGSERNGFDNGTEVRRVTRDAVTFMTGPLTVRSAQTQLGTLFPLPR